MTTTHPDPGGLGMTSAEVRAMQTRHAKPIPVIDAENDDQLREEVRDLCARVHLRDDHHTTDAQHRLPAWLLLVHGPDDLPERVEGPMPAADGWRWVVTRGAAVEGGFMYGLEVTA